MHLTMPFVTRNADEGAGVSRWRHPFNLVGPPQNLGILAWTSRTLLSILRPEWGDADIAARIEQSTRPMSDAQWARMLDFGVVSTIMFTYLLRRREKIPRFPGAISNSERGACVVLLQKFTTPSRRIVIIQHESSSCGASRHIMNFSSRRDASWSPQSCFRTKWCWTKFFWTIIRLAEG